MAGEVVNFTAPAKEENRHRLIAYQPVNEVLQAESEGQHCKAGALFVHLGRLLGCYGLFDKSEARAVVSAAQTHSSANRKRK